MSFGDHKIVQLAGGTKPQNDDYVGRAGELTVDFDNWALRLHDGETPGGYVIVNLTQAKETFQARSTELDGLLGFKDQDRGLLARLGPGTYRLRQIKVDDRALTVTRGNGYGGDPVIGFADEITRDVGISGILTTSDQIMATGGLKGDVEGDLIGDVTGDVTGNVTGDLTGDSEGTHTGNQTGGNVDVREHTLFLDAGEIHLAALNDDVRAYVFDNSARVGSIVIWGGDLDEIPDGWVLCNGANGTPDLRELFVVGAGGTYAVGATGGSGELSGDLTTGESGGATITMAVEAHALTAAELPSHKHFTAKFGNGGDATVAGNTPTWTEKTSSGNSNYRLVSGGQAEPDVGYSSGVGDGQGHAHDASFDIANHTHSVDLSGGILPPYMALCYIMRTE